MDVPLLGAGSGARYLCYTNRTIGQAAAVRHLPITRRPPSDIDLATRPDLEHECIISMPFLRKSSRPQESRLAPPSTVSPPTMRQTVDWLAAAPSRVCLTTPGPGSDQHCPKGQFRSSLVIGHPKATAFGAATNGTLGPSVDRTQCLSLQLVIDAQPGPICKTCVAAEFSPCRQPRLATKNGSEE